VLATYHDARGREHEIVCRDGANGTRLVTDRAIGACEDERLLAHLEADEPEHNATLICDLYLADGHRACRALIMQDFTSAPLAPPENPPDGILCEQPVDKQNRAYRLALTRTGAHGQQLRWHRHPKDEGSPVEAVSVRQAIGGLESYEPIRTMTRQAIARDEQRGRLHCAILSTELRRVEEGKGVLNRRLREAVHAAVSTHGASLSEIASRCDRGRRGNLGCAHGDTSWLRRRIGDLKDTREAEPTPWITSDTLALIARHGLGIDPREAEVS
jgi:hypothetical protein